MRYIIRRLAPFEKQKVAPLAEMFHAAARIKSTFSEQALARTLSSANIGIIGMFFEGQLVGVIVGLVSPQMITSAIIAQEIMWFVLPDHRGARESLNLFDAFEAWAKERGATDIIMASLADDKVGKLYMSRGYTPIETHFIKHIA